MPLSPQAGNGEPVYLTLRLESGEAGPFLLDTGANASFADASLIPSLGKRRSWTRVRTYDGIAKAAVYDAPPIYLGAVRLLTGPRILVLDPDTAEKAPPPRRPKVLGVLGMDCLRHYCLQLDFDSHIVRFLDPAQPPAMELGYAFTMHDGWVDHNLLGSRGVKTQMDTGDVTDGAFKSRQLAASPGAIKVGRNSYWLPASAFGDLACTNLLLHAAHNCTLGLEFLARYIVTLNFPANTLHLRPRTNLPASTNVIARTLNTPAGPSTLEAMDFLAELLHSGRLPGATNADETLRGPDASVQTTNYPLSRTFLIQTPQFVNHYTVIKKSPKHVWRLQKAWQTDLEGKTIQDLR